jgi:hypothetical protein
MREFVDSEGVAWSVGVTARPGQDYKGRYVFAAAPAAGRGEGEVVLEDVRWNSEKSARRTLATMSPVELERRIAWARGRAAP